MATTLQKGLFGGDPVALQQAEQQRWASMYGQAGSPYEKMGLGLAQLGGALFGGESSITTKTNAVNKALENAAALYTAGTPEYYKAVAEDPALANYADSKEFATQKYLEAKKAETAEFAAERKGVREDPGSVDVYAPKYATTLLNKARAKGFDPTTEAVPETSMRYRIRSIPTMALFKNGVEVARMSGALSAADIIRWVQTQNIPSS